MPYSNQYNYKKLAKNQDSDHNQTYDIFCLRLQKQRRIICLRKLGILKNLLNFLLISVTMYSCLDKINVWLKLNKLTVNVSKTKCMDLHKRRDVPVLNLLINNIDIESVSHFTFLSIILDTALS